MSWLKKRGFAACVLVLAAVLSVVLGGGWKLDQARAEAEDAFFNGKAGFSVYSDLMELRETSYNLLHISEPVPGADAAQRTAASAWAKLDEAKTPEALASACSELYEAVGVLDAALSIDDPTLQASWERQLRNFDEYISHLRFDSYYDEKAAAYNQLLRDPLSGFLGELSGNGRMPRFTELF